MANTRSMFWGVISGTALALAGGIAGAQEITLKLHQFLPAQANVPKLILDKWAADVEAASDGRIAVDHFPAMQLGGTPPELIDQARDGIADVVWTVVGYTPGRFPRTEVFELPFFVEDAGAASAAFAEMMEGEMGAEFDGLKILGSWVHGPGVIHASDPVTTPADLRGLKIRGASRQVNTMLETLGATPVGMPVPAVPEALSKGVIDGTTIPWEVTGSLKVPDLVANHTEFTGPMLYTLAFVLAMNAETYDSLPEDLRSVVDAQSGRAFSVFAGQTMVAVDGPAREAALDLGNEVITLNAEESAAWAAAAAPVYDAWLADMAERGIDGQALIDEARARMAAFAN